MTRFKLIYLLFAICGMVIVINLIIHANSLHDANHLLMRSSTNICQDQNKEKYHNRSIYHFHSSKCPPIHGTIAIVQVASGTAYINGEALNAMQSLRCYAKMRDYALYQFDISARLINKISKVDEANKMLSNCKQFKGILSKRHCLAAQLMSFYDYVIHIDADSGVVNPHHCFEEYIHPEVDMHFLLRIHTGEVQAGHYIMKSTELSKNFLLGWANETKTNDQPVLHSKLSKMFLTSQDQENCLKLKNNYFKWIKCLVSTMRSYKTTISKHLLLYHRGQTFVRDGWACHFHWSPNDFMFHAMKRQDDVVFTRRLRQEDCENDVWVIPSKKELYVDNIASMRKKWLSFDQKYFGANQFGLDVGIGPCWPNCSNVVV